MKLTGISCAVATLICASLPSALGEKIQLLEDRDAGYPLRSIGTVKEARRIAVPEAGAHLLVLTGQGRVWAWGDNSQGQLSGPDQGAQNAWVQVEGPNNAIGVAAGALHSAALASDGSIWTWGANDQGQLGDGSLVSRRLPRPVMKDAVVIAAGRAFTLALRTDGTVWAFGSNWNLIVPGEARRMITEPVQVSGLTAIEALAVRENRGYARDKQGRVWVWGHSGSEETDARPHVSVGADQDLRRRFVRGMRPLLEAARWPGSSARQRLVRVNGTSLEVIEDGTAHRQLFDGTAVDVEAGWAVALITVDSEESTSRFSKARKAKAHLESRGLFNAIARPLGASLPTLTAYENHGLAIKTDGTVCSCGRNDRGQLGDATVVDRWTPVTAARLGGVRGISTGNLHTLAVLNDGTVWSWGYNSSGELGDGSQYDRPTPFPVPGLSGMIAVAAGYDHSLALKSDGTVWAWGSNRDGELGTGGIASYQLTPVKVASLSQVIAIAAGENFSLALKSDGSVWGWGYNFYGQLGNGTNTEQWSPVAVTGMTNVKAIAAGYQYGLALKNDGTAWGWGRDGYGELGAGSTGTRLSAVKASNLTGVVAIAGGRNHSLFLKGDGTVWASGNNASGQLGDGTKTNRLTPGPVSGLTGAVAIAAGLAHSLALTSNNSLFGWGHNVYGQIGSGTASSTPQLVPKAASSCIAPEKPPKPAPSSSRGRIIARESYSLAMKSDGTVLGWGQNSWGQLGDGTTTARCSPVPAKGLTGVSGIATSGEHSLAVKSDGTVWSWGYNLNGQLGDGTTNGRLAPGIVPAFSGVAAVAAGGRHSIALKRDGTVWAWGSNISGDLGDGTKVDRHSPGRVLTLTGVTAIAAGYDFNLALRTDGSVWGWGENGYGQLADGTSTDRLTPIQIPGLTDVVAIAAGRHAHGVALKNDGTVWSWGDQHGDGSLSRRFNIVRVSDLTNVLDIAGGADHSLAVKSDGTVWAWGTNGYGKLGDASSTNRTTPVKVSSLTEAVTVAAGFWHSLALKKDGWIWSWGSNQYGQFGVCTPTQSAIPVQGPRLDSSGSPPSQFNLVSPVNNAQNLALTIPLKWQAASGATSYDVRLGTTNPPPFVASTTATTYNGTGLAGGTTYYWQIVAKNSAGETPSLIWSFTTKAAKPGAMTNPSPANLAKNVSRTPTLRWQGGAGATSFDVYFGTATNPPKVANVTVTSFTPPGALLAKKKYYWKVIAKNTAGTTSSATWSFTTQ